MSGCNTDEDSLTRRIHEAERISCLLVNKKEYDKCITYVQSSLKESVDSFTLRMNEVACYINKQAWENAVTALKGANERYKASVLTIRQKELSAMYYALAEQEIGDKDAAEKTLRELALTRKDDEIIQLNYCLALVKRARYREAIERLLEVILKNPKWGAPYFTVANCYQNLGLDGEAIFWYRQTLDRMDAPHVRLNLAISLLRSGRYKEGWREFENRPRSWNLEWLECNWKPGDDLKGKTVAVITDEGVGDAIMFLPLLKELINDASKHVVYTDKRLASIFKRCIPDLVIETRVNDNRYKEYDVFMRLASLAGVYYNDKTSIASRKSYLTSDELMKQKWAGELLSSKRLKIGIGWRGGVGNDAIERRSIPLKQWEILGKGLDVDWISLQHHAEYEEIRAASVHYGVSIRLYESLSADLESLTAVIDNLDLVITCEQTVAHIAGALGKRCLVLAANPPGWRYVDDSEVGNDCRMLWYESVTLLQKGDWELCEGYIRRLGEQISGVI